MNNEEFAKEAWTPKCSNSQLYSKMGKEELESKFLAFVKRQTFHPLQNTTVGIEQPLYKWEAQLEYGQGEQF